MGLYLKQALLLQLRFARQESGSWLAITTGNPQAHRLKGASLPFWSSLWGPGWIKSAQGFPVLQPGNARECIYYVNIHGTY